MALSDTPTMPQLGPSRRLWPLFLAFFAFSSLYVFLTILYNLFFHPLRRYPGPFLARISWLWSRIRNFHGCKSERIHAAHERYGPIVRIGPNELSFANPAAVRDIYNSKSFVKEETFYRAKRIFHEDHMFSFRNVEAHNQRRKLLARGFSQVAINQFETNLVSKIQTLLDQWERLSRSTDEPINVYPWVHWLGFDTVYHLMFDEDPGSVKKGIADPIMKYLHAWRPTFIYKEFMPQLEQWGPYVPGEVGGYFRDVQTWKKVAMNIVGKVRVNGAKTPFLSNVLNDQDAYLGRPLNDSELAEECMGGMFGGSGSTANTFVYVLWGCLRNPDVVRKLKQELTTAFPDRSVVPDNLTCSGLTYLQAAIKETLRRYPAVIATLPRTAVEDVVVAGHALPKGTIVGTQNYTLHRWTSAFPDAENFDPDRWFSKKSDEERKLAFTPFSVGPRRCIGMNLAEMELNLLTASFFLRFDAAIDPSMTEEDMRQYDTFNAGPTGAKLLLHLKTVEE
ncbi:uncharacterized protein A1O5_10403 [Cladophialophora psammophila CBS 110553]|uniref:Cytochrome P450 oxidoreductase n=1 Tax=Cladophialophora psammophila CBS 110553 TaxID=1182543 RepID=W9WNL0_9EURO|nr:uncharacterized protein A1O5_10403 [Cladophialophora psammophila CBS 110553]EXJ66251.1 hypothetical protein A1O5_10403 [Cladophialophora psammophila CBS 110553]